MRAAAEENHYTTLGLDKTCSAVQIRDAYRALAKRLHPDVNGASKELDERIRRLNEAYETLSEPARRRSYDRELERASREAAPRGREKIERNLTQEVRLTLQDFLRGTSLQVRVNDPANADGAEIYEVEIPAMSAPGARLQIPRGGIFAGGVVQLRLKMLPGFRFKNSGSDLRTDLRISAQRAAEGGTEMIEGPNGGRLRVKIPARAKRGEIIRLAGEGMPKPRGGRGDLLVRISYRAEVHVTRGKTTRRF